MTAHDTDELGDRAHLSREECLDALRSARVGRVVTTVGEERRPLVRPVSYVYDVATGSIVFHSMAGAKLHALLDRRDACFEIDGEADGSLWSVIVRGRVETEDRRSEIERLARVLSPSVAIGDGRWLRVRGEVVTGRRFPLPPAE